MSSSSSTTMMCFNRLVSEPSHRCSVVIRDRLFPTHMDTEHVTNRL